MYERVTEEKIEMGKDNKPVRRLYVKYVAMN